MMNKKDTRSPTRILLEFEVAQSQWEYEHGYYKVYDSAAELMRDIKESNESYTRKP